jgi:hypothetical protein
MKQTGMASALCKILWIPCDRGFAILWRKMPMLISKGFKFRSLGSAGLLSVSLLTLPVAHASMEKSASGFDCPDQVDQCSFIPDPSVDQGQLVQRVTAAVYGDINPINPNYLRSSGRLIYFWDTEAKTREKIKTALLSLNHKDSLPTAPNIYVNVKIYTIDDAAYNNIESSFEFANGHLKPGSAVTSSGAVDSANGAFNIAAVLGNLRTSALSIKLDNLHTNNRSDSVDSFSGQTHPGDDIGISRTTPLYLPTSISTEKDSAGINISGTATLDGTNPNVVHISGFSLRYAVPTGAANSLATAFSYSRTFVDIPTDKSFVLATNALDSRKNSNLNGWFIFHMGRSATSQHSRMIVVINAQIDDPNRPKPAFVPHVPLRISDRDAEALPSGDEHSLAKLLDSIKATVSASGDGDPTGDKIRLSVDGKYLTQNTFDKVLRIDIKVGGQTQTLTPAIETLALEPVLIDGQMLTQAGNLGSSDCVVNAEVRAQLDSRVDRNSTYKGQRDFKFKLQYLPRNQTVDLERKN